tara:strand:+ start:79 stop:891 length:813 start_codon:yes stop_codon:yes gene_type:complete
VKKGRKARYRDITCIDCGKVFFGYASRKRCEPCVKRYAKEYSKQYWEARRNPDFVPGKFKKIKRECPDCGRNFIADPRRPRCKKCGEIRKKKWDKVHREKQEAKRKSLRKGYYSHKKVCQHCSKEFMGANCSKYCSKECKKVAERPIRNVRARERNKTDKGKSKALLKSWHRRALMYDAYLPDSCEDEMAQFDALQRKATKLSGVQHHVDHIIPLFLGGAHHQDNLRVITIHENSSKRASYDSSLGGKWADNALAKETKKLLKQHQQLTN